jgi:hypothetical protein
MKSIFILILLCFIISTGTGFGQKARPDDGLDADSSFKEQQSQLNTQLINYAEQQVKILNAMKDSIGREQYDSAWDYLPDTPQFQQQMRNIRGDDDFNYSRARLDNLRLKTMEAESRKNELKMKIIDYNNQIPEWWDKVEAEFIERRRQVVQSGLRR